MKKTLYCEIERKSAFDMPTYKKVTAEKIEELEEGRQNLYKDEDGNLYIVHYNSFKRREEFTSI